MFVGHLSPISGEKCKEMLSSRSVSLKGPRFVVLLRSWVKSRFFLIGEAARGKARRIFTFSWRFLGVIVFKVI